MNSKVNNQFFENVKNTTVCIIPARGGSKRLKRKNLRMINGKPMIQWAIEACKNSKLLLASNIVVSSEDKEILDFALSQGVSIITRPPELAEDDVWTQEVLVHALLSVKARIEKNNPEGVITGLVRVQANSPQVTGQKIDECIEKLWHTNSYEVFTVNQDGIEDGAIHAMKTHCVFQQALSVYKAVVETNYIDIHTEKDLEAAEDIMKSRELFDEDMFTLEKKIKNFLTEINSKEKKTHSWRLSTPILVSYYNLIEKDTNLLAYYSQNKKVNTNSKKVLDLGCGLGVYWPYLQDIGYDDFTGIDLFSLRKESGLTPPHEITGAESYMKDASSVIQNFCYTNVTAKLIEADVRNIDRHLGDQKFDLIFAHAASCIKANNTGISKEIFDDICQKYLSTDGISIYNG